jgi:hypothetical protein
MSTPGAACHYRIVVRGECGGLLADLIEGAAIESGEGLTFIVALVRDQSELYGLLDRLQELALPIVSLTDLSAPASSPAATPGR